MTDQRFCCHMPPNCIRSTSVTRLLPAETTRLSTLIGTKKFHSQPSVKKFDPRAHAPIGLHLHRFSGYDESVFSPVKHMIRKKCLVYFSSLYVENDRDCNLFANEANIVVQ